MNNENTPDTVNDDAVTDSKFPDMKFEDLPSSLADACAQAGWDKLMPVQEKALPYLLNNTDVMVQARTGSGKTGAFVLPLMEKLDPNIPQCQALVMVPTRELAQQVAQEARLLAGESGINVVAVYGGVGYQQQLDAFREGAQLVVGTPGRILDHLVRRSLLLDSLKVLIFDEADRMLSVGFYPDMVEVKRYLPRNIDGSFMFSATFPQSVLRLAEEFMSTPDFLSLSSDEANVSAITHQFVEVSAMGKERKLIKLIELENPASAIIFANTKRNVEFTAELLSQFGFDAEGLTSDLTQNKREKLMARIKEGKLRFLVATDVAARGIDIPELSHVFMMEPPEDPESYVHRAGRTGRAGASGTAITLVDVIQKMELERIASRFKIKFDEVKDPTEEDVAAIIEERLTALLEKKFRKLTHLQRERAARFLPLAKKYGEAEDTMGLIAMLLDEIYQNTLHGKPAEPELKQHVSQDAKNGSQEGGRRAKNSGNKPSGGRGRQQREMRGEKSHGNGGQENRGRKRQDARSESKERTAADRPERPVRENRPKRVAKDQPKEQPVRQAESSPQQTEDEGGAAKRRRRPRRRRRRS
ncbi:DEAD/DEAH box helicase [Pseudodesulfovibrio piezophilus]|uniref:DEAD/DEAH box helicase domain protein n=1 Tax=Pseudodesulfovibrio piezophilus (strain DSM 21447 / JCM 15486 / C1TLV30) TaxID=1322246 RepID=M1WJM9_PSEP2|nr:DEAD/DEAH box helicase [Pseudodesulfovibrio piezophilus]CCH48176.1 DEAD/DEAH box helicase domain protein [Pseudodesulfovibrio piezophilus C1TLV30]